MSSGGYSGVTSGDQISLESLEARNTAIENEEMVATQLLIKEIESNGTKFTKEHMVFIIRDKTGEIMWLETGNSNAGLEHIISRHADDFKSKHNIAKDGIAKHLKNVFSEGTVIYSREIKKNNRRGLEKLYFYKDKYYLLSGVGTNGFIVSGYPIDKEVALKLKERYRK